MAGRCRLVAGSLLLALALMAQPASRPLDRTSAGPPAAPRFVASLPPIIRLRVREIALPEVEPQRAPSAAADAVWEDAVRAGNGRDEKFTRMKPAVPAREPLSTIFRAAGVRVLRLTTKHLPSRVPPRAGRTILAAAHQSPAAPMMSPSYGTITSRFGWRIHPIFGTAEFHTGLDIANRYGTPVRAALSGIVRFTGWMAGYGRLVVVDHGGGLQTSYSHLSAMLVSLGERVLKGQILGQIGSTGWSTGPHLFFEVRRNGVPVDPVPLLRRSGAISAGPVR